MGASARYAQHRMHVLVGLAGILLSASALQGYSAAPTAALPPIPAAFVDQAPLRRAGLEHNSRVTLHAAGRGYPFVNLRDGREVPTAYVGAARLPQLMQQGQAEPLALAADDFDEDGVPDLVSGFGTPGGGVVTLHRGNVESIFPHSPAARQRQAQGELLAAPFFPSALVFAVPEPAELIGTGDFDNDGHRDLVVTAVGSAGLYLLSGNGRGGLNPAQRLELAGGVTALTTGEINRPDGLADVVVAVSGPRGPQALVFEGPTGALRRQPEALSLPREAKALALGEFAGDYATDLAMAVGDELLIVRGRDRRLSLDAASRAEAPPAMVDQLTLPAPIVDLEAGNFTDQVQTEVALLGEDGRVYLARASQAPDPQRSGRAYEANEEVAWQSELLSSGPWHAASGLVRTRSSALSGDDLVMVDPANRRLHLLASGPVTRRPMGPFMGNSTALPMPRVSVQFQVESEPRAILPMRLNGDALNDLVFLHEGSGTPSVVVTAVGATITVNSTLDSDVRDSVLTLREAILVANGALAPAALTPAEQGQVDGSPVTPGLDAIQFATFLGTFTINVGSSGLGALPAITDPVTLDGTVGLVGRMELNGTAAGAAAAGLICRAGNSTVRDLAIGLFGGDGLVLRDAGSNFVERLVAVGNGADGVHIQDAPRNTIGGSILARNIISGNGDDGVEIFGRRAIGNLVQGNLIGTNSLGFGALGNAAAGVDISDASLNIIGGATLSTFNVISSNASAGVEIFGSDASGNRVQGNFIGTNILGSGALGNTGAGVFILDAPTTTIGGTAAGARNVISGNGSNGVAILGSDASDNVVQGNFIGTNILGSGALGNTGAGVFILDAPTTTIGGTAAGARNVISGNGRDGVEIDGSDASGNVVQGNFIGTNILGSGALGNTGAGVLIRDAPTNTIGGTAAFARNVISGNGGSGVAIFGSDASGNVVQGNFIGTSSSGTSDLGNRLSGVSIRDAPTNTIGGTAAGARNVISGNGGSGVVMQGPNASRNVVQGNFIGTSSNGASDLGNTGAGVMIFASANTIGGTAAGARNVISGNEGSGVAIQGSDASGNVVQGNFIGTNILGSGALGNTFSGVLIRDASANTIGGTAAGARNVISGNEGSGIVTTGENAAGNLVQGNRIGVRAFGLVTEVNLGNTSHGVSIQNGASANRIKDNAIAFNGGAGVQLADDAGTGNVIADPNSIFSNVGLGINLVGGDETRFGFGVTANDPGDTDTGPNNLQNYPELLGASTSKVRGRLNSTSNTLFRIEFFASQECDPSGFGEGERFLGAIRVRTDGNGDAAIDFPLPATLPSNQFVAATATEVVREENGVILEGNTSEFSNCIPVDTQSPVCALRIRTPSVIEVAVRDVQSGVESIEVVQLVNATVEIPRGSGTFFKEREVFRPPTPRTDEILVQAVKLNPGAPAILVLRVTDAAGNLTNCDPVVVRLEIPRGRVSVRQTLTGILQAERYITVQNGAPGLKALHIRVNSRRSWITVLRNRVERTFDIASAMTGGDNTVVLTGSGRPGASALVIIADSPVGSTGHHSRGTATTGHRHSILNMEWGVR